MNKSAKGFNLLEVMIAVALAACVVAVAYPLIRDHELIKAAEDAGVSVEK